MLGGCGKDREKMKPWIGREAHRHWTSSHLRAFLCACSFLSWHMFVHCMLAHFHMRAILFYRKRLLAAFDNTIFDVTGLAIHLSFAIWNLITWVPNSIPIFCQLPLFTPTFTEMCMRMEIALDHFYCNSTEDKRRQKLSPGSRKAGSYMVHAMLGQGDLGKVKLLTGPKTRFPFAVKVIRRNNLCDSVSHNRAGQDEKGVMRVLNSGNMVNLHKVMTYSKRVCDSALCQEVSHAAPGCHSSLSCSFRVSQGCKTGKSLLSTNGRFKATDFGFSAMKDQDNSLLKRIVRVRITGRQKNGCSVCQAML